MLIPKPPMTTSRWRIDATVHLLLTMTDEERDETLGLVLGHGCPENLVQNVELTEPARVSTEDTPRTTCEVAGRADSIRQETNPQCITAPAEKLEPLTNTKDGGQAGEPIPSVAKPETDTPVVSCCCASAETPTVDGEKKDADWKRKEPWWTLFFCWLEPVPPEPTRERLPDAAEDAPAITNCDSGQKQSKEC